MTSLLTHSCTFKERFSTTGHQANYSPFSAGYQAAKILSDEYGQLLLTLPCCRLLPTQAMSTRPEDCTLGRTTRLNAPSLHQPLSRNFGKASEPSVPASEVKTRLDVRHSHCLVCRVVFFLFLFIFYWYEAAGA